MLRKWMLMLCVGLILSGCGGVPVTRYSQEAPKLDLRKYFTGRVEAWGMFQKRSGEVTKRFTVLIDGHSEGEVLVMHEAFSYSDGTKQVREWRLRPDGPGRWKGTAGDVVGEAYGEVAGNSFHWNYVLRLPVDGTEYDVSLDDWMYLIDEQTMANRSSMTKLGVEVGQITLFFRKAGK